MDYLCEAPVFVVGSARSGTTLVYSVLMCSGDFAIYEAETHLLSNYSIRYGDIRNDKNYERFINEWLQSERFLHSKLDPEDFTMEAEKHRHSYMDFLAFFMASIAKRQGKRRWAENTPAHVYFMEKLSNKIPDARFIHVIRDGRDVALSKRKIGWTGIKVRDPMAQLVAAAMFWKMDVTSGQRYGKKMGKKYIEIRYEDLILDPEETLRKISDFTGTKIDKEALRNSSIGSLRRANTAFDEEIVGISSECVDRWKTSLNEKELYLLNSIIGSTLIRLGYHVDGFDNRQNRRLLVKFKTYSILFLALLRVRRFAKQFMVGRFRSRVASNR